MPQSGAESTFSPCPLPFFRGLQYHRSFLMSEMVILAVGLSVRILCSKAEGNGAEIANAAWHRVLGPAACRLPT